METQDSKTKNIRTQKKLFIVCLFIIIVSLYIVVVDGPFSLLEYNDVSRYNPEKGPMLIFTLVAVICAFYSGNYLYKNRN